MCMIPFFFLKHELQAMKFKLPVRYNNFGFEAQNYRFNVLVNAELSEWGCGPMNRDFEVWCGFVHTHFSLARLYFMY